MSQEQEPQAASLRKNIAAYTNRQRKLEQRRGGEYSVFCARETIDFFNTFEVAALEAVHRLGCGPHLIGKIAQEIIRLPSSVMFAHAR